MSWCVFGFHVHRCTALPVQAPKRRSPWCGRQRRLCDPVLCGSSGLLTPTDGVEWPVAGNTDGDQRTTRIPSWSGSGRSLYRFGTIRARTQCLPEYRFAQLKPDWGRDRLPDIPRSCGPAAGAGATFIKGWDLKVFPMAGPWRSSDRRHGRYTSHGWRQAAPGSTDSRRTSRRFYRNG
jgi:hypothetical protein